MNLYLPPDFPHDPFRNTKKSPNSLELGLFSIGRQLPTLPDITLVPSAQLGLTSLFEMGRGGP